jgi:surface protein
MRNMFYNCTALLTVPLFDTKKVTNMPYMFYGCGALTTVPSFDIRNVPDLSDAFNSCKALTECWVRNIKTSIQVGYGTYFGHLLTLESLLHLCKECRNVNASRTLTVGTANLEKLANVYVKLIPITDEMRAEDDLIDEKYPFVQCESTDEGAMTIADYMTTKMWTLK